MRKHGECDGKRRFATQAAADVFAATHPIGPVRVYECPQCGLWHLTSQVPLASARRRPFGMKRSAWRKVNR